MNLLSVARYYLSRNPSESPTNSTDDAPHESPGYTLGLSSRHQLIEQLATLKRCCLADAERLGDGCSSEAWAFNSLVRVASWLCNARIIVGRVTS